MVGLGRARGRAETWPQPRAARWRGAPWPFSSDFLRTLASHLKEAAATDFGPGRLMPWVPVAFGAGIALYFSAEREPSWIAATAALVILAAMTFIVRHRPVGFPACIILCAAAAGFAVVTARATWIAHPVIERAVYGVTITGFVETREERERTDRVVVRVHSFDDGRTSIPPERVRLSVKRGTAPAVGEFISLKARLNPPPTPTRPGGYDFARDLYFQRIGAVGFVTGEIKADAPPAALSLQLRYAAFIDSVRDGIDRRIRSAVPGDAGAIASALITGKRDAISASVNDAMYVSSLAHVLSISGYHMALVAGVVFFVVRALLALVPGLSSRRPIKKWSAVAALVAAAGYLALSGAEVATQRAFVMTAIVLIGVMIDRAALTLRTLAVAALAVLLISPQAVVHPSFQMSFAATLALVAAYERGIPWALGGGDTSAGARVALWGGRQMVTLILASLVAGLATTPYAAFHFHRAAPYGVLANLLAMPIVSIWVMPAGLVALVAAPFGLDGPLWRLMAAGIEWMISVAVWVASLPGAVGRVPAFGLSALLVATAGLVVLCLFRSRVRWAGAALVALACALALAPQRPDVLISSAGDAVAVRGADGKLSVMRFEGNPFAVREWLAADADARLNNDPKLKEGFSCDDAGCVARLSSGAVVALARTAEALADDCKRAALVVTTRQAPPGCAATVIDRSVVRAKGALSLRQDGDTWRIEATRPPGTDRPWARAAAGAPDVPTAIRNRPTVRDATPRAEDLDVDD
jgi:competence protein ComEC